MEKTTILVVHDRRLKRQLLDCFVDDRLIVEPGDPILGFCAKSIVFVDTPGPGLTRSQAWLSGYRDWVAGALITCLTPDGVVVGLPDAARSEATAVCLNAFI